MPTIKDVAREAGVSIATVSYVLNNKTEFYSKDTEQQVLEAARRIGYTPNITARNLRSSRTRLLGYAWHQAPGDRINMVLDRFMYHLAQAAERAGYHLMTFTHPTDDPIPTYDDLIRSGRVDGFVLADTIVDDPRIRFLMDEKFPFVSFGRSNPEWEFCWVDTDGDSGVYDAVCYLLELGHTQIGIVGWPEGSLTGDFRLAGYKRALESVGLSIRSEYIVRSEHDERAAAVAFARWLALPADQRPTAVIAVSDMIAVGVVHEAMYHGLIPGKTLSVIGFDDTPVVRYMVPAMTTVRQPLAEIGQALVEMLEDLVNNRSPSAPQRVLRPELVVRDSCARVE